MSLFGSLNTSYTGLKVSSLATDTISNNIANAENPDYTRQRINVTTKIALTDKAGQIGTGAEVDQILRIHDEFVFRRMLNASASLENSSFQEKILVELSEYFPDVDEAGLERDLINFFSGWQKLSSNPADDAQKIVLASASVQLGKNFQSIRDKLTDTQNTIDELIVSGVDEVNRLGQRVAELNKQISIVETQKYQHANSLRDERDKLEKAIVKLIDPLISKTNIQTLTDINSDIADFGQHYSIEIGGYQIVDGVTFHPLVASAAKNSSGGLNSILFQKSDHKLEDISQNVVGGKLGAILDLRGRKFDKDSGEAVDGKIQSYKDNLDMLARGVIQSVNTIYAKSSDTLMMSDSIGNTIGFDAELRNLQLGKLYPQYLKNTIQKGDMVFSTYDITGRYTGDFKVEINPTKQSLTEVIETINAEFKNQGINASAKPYLGTIKFENGGQSSGKEMGAVLLKQDNSLLVSALDITNYRSLKEVDALEIPFEIQNGTFKVNVFNQNGETIASREIKIDKDTDNPLFSTLDGIIAQINMKNIDDNKDNDLTNDVDNLISASFSDNKLKIQVDQENADLYFNIEDAGTGFAGAIGLHKFFDGNSATNIDLVSEYKTKTEKINAYDKPVEGNNGVANSMQQLQYDNIDFFGRFGGKTNETIIGQYRYTAGRIAEDTHAIELDVDTFEALYNSVSKQHESVSSVNLDEELADLIKYQTGYGANARVVTTVQNMLDTLLGIKT